jgi:hypothetical protein
VAPVGTEDTVQNMYYVQLFHLSQQELERKAHHESLVLAAVRARRRNRKAARATRALHLASDAVAQAGGVLNEGRSSVVAGR